MYYLPLHWMVVSVHHAPVRFTPRERIPVPIKQEAHGPQSGSERLEKRNVRVFYIFLIITNKCTIITPKEILFSFIVKRTIF